MFRLRYLAYIGRDTKIESLPELVEDLPLILNKGL
jgi:hypothetical protein